MPLQNWMDSISLVSLHNLKCFLMWFFFLITCFEKQNLEKKNMNNWIVMSGSYLGVSETDSGECDIIAMRGAAQCAASRAPLAPSAHSADTPSEHICQTNNLIRFLLSTHSFLFFSSLAINNRPWVSLLSLLGFQYP